LSVLSKESLQLVVEVRVAIVDIRKKKNASDYPQELQMREEEGPVEG
jgi:hypothetical protein